MIRLLAALFVLSAALIAFQLGLMRILAIVQWDHFAALCISVSLLGFGVSGTLLSLWRSWFLRHCERLLPLLMLGSGLSMALVVPISQSIAGGFDTYQLFIDVRQPWLLLLTQGLLLIPMLLVALAIGLCFMRQVDKVSRLYAANLLGSALGGPLVLLLMSVLLPQQLPAACGLAALLAGLLLLRGRKQLLAGLLPLLPILYLLWAPPPLQPSQYKSLSYALELPQAELRATRTAAEGLLQLVEAPAMRYSAELGLHYQGQLPGQRLLLINGDSAASLPSASREELGHLLNQTPAALSYRLGPRAKVLLLGSDLAGAAALAVENHAETVVAVLPHAALLRQLSSALPWLDSSHASALITRAQQPRTYLARAERRFDLILLPPVGSFGGNAGLTALAQQPMLTEEGLLSAWRHLTEDGVLQISSWLDAPPRNPLRLTALLLSMLRQAEVTDPVRHMVALRSWNRLTLLVKRSPFSESEVAIVLAFCADNQFDPTILPDRAGVLPSHYHRLGNSQLLPLLDQILASNSPALDQSYPFRLSPPTDDQPFFSQFLRLQHLPRLSELLELRSIPFLELGYLVLWVTFVQLVLLALLLIIVPLFKLGWRGGGRLRSCGYFAGLGIGFMFFEMALLQQLVRYLGHPLYAAAAAISTLLFFSGLGSYWSDFLPMKRSLLQKLLMGLVLLLFLYPFILSPLLSATIHLSLSARALVAILLCGLPAFLMGCPFPLGLRHQARREERLVPWAWGINGCLSVVATPLASIIAVEAGFSVLMLLAALAYSGALLSSQFAR